VTMARLVEARDPYTAGHEERVTSLSVAIAQEMGLDERKIVGLEVAARLHDIGKVSVPAEILAKPGRLSEAEFSLVRGHAAASGEILSSIDFPWPIAKIVVQHHERLDGSGYPNGLRNGEILTEARILAVADVVEAMWAHRPYRPSLGLEAALDEIARGRGWLYDRQAVDACIRLFRENRFSFE
jgi:putative nucleotidyltransferase with HDIG domain